TLAQAAYEAGGGVLGALAHRAEDVYATLDGSEQEAARQVMLRLVNTSESSEATRRRVRRTELDRLDILSGTVDAVLAAFGTARLISFDRDLATRGPTVEVAHEAIFTQWERLADWIEAHREDLILSRRLSAAVTDWDTAGRDPAYLLSGGRLSQFESWADSTDLALTSTEHHYLIDSRAAEDDRIASRRRRRRATTAGFAAAAVVAIVLATVAWVQRGVAQQEASLAQARELVGEAEAVVEFDPELSGLLALSAVTAFDAAGEQAVPEEAVSALRSFVAAQRVELRVPGGRFAAVHPDGSLLATTDGNDVAVWDITAGEVVERYARDDGAAAEAAFSPDGKHLAVVYHDSNTPVTIWDRTSSEAVEIGEGTVGDLPIIAFSPDGQLLAFGSVGPGIDVWAMDGLRRVRNIEGFGPDFDREGLLSLGYCSDDESGSCEVRVVDTQSGEKLRAFSIDVPPWFTAWSPDGSRLAAADQDTAVILDAVSGQEISRTDVDRVYQPRWLPSGEVFVVGGETVPRLIDPTSGEVVLDLVAGTGGSEGVAVVPGASLVASAGMGGETVIFDTSELGGFELGGWVAPVTTTLHATFQSDGRKVVIADQESVASGDAVDGSDLVSLVGAPRSESGWFPLPSRDGSLTPLADADGAWVVRRTDTGDIVYRAPEGWGIRGVDADTSRAVIFREDGSGEYRTLLVSTADGSTLAELEAGFLGKVAFSPDGELVVTHNLDPSAAPYATAIFR
ncbi:MAG: WD40 repeat domain-containing protein, partial [Actinomycetota bacterium]|nr:WD40 repeat domain-containing protein [Actinomycetota bacterium]